ncbi:MAG: tripartite tricarboxylate transporter substrate binding protein [Burkholderiales bacterium]|nr:tripartite tricarboxylate transporter substrate binding protein [Burkholderiales bacterium]
MNSFPVSLRRRHGLALALTLCCSLPVAAQGGFPVRALTLVVPYTAGGASDIGARMISSEIGRQLGQTVVVDNVGGAAGALGTLKVVRAPADGHTLLYGSLSEALLVPLVNPSAGYRTDDLLPVAYLGGTPVVFVVRPDFPANTLDELIALAKKNPAKYSYGSPGMGTFQHVMGEAFKAKAGVFMLHIPYRGGAQILTDVIGGQIDIGITSAVNAASFVANGRLKAIGVSSAARNSAVPKAQPFGESAALKGVELSTWGIAFVPKGTPDAVVQRLNGAINAALMTPSNVEARARLGAELPAVMSPTQTRAFVSSEQAKYAPIVKSIKFE